jgi:hypothetical protein
MPVIAKEPRGTGVPPCGFGPLRRRETRLKAIGIEVRREDVVPALAQRRGNGSNRLRLKFSARGWAWITRMRIAVPAGVFSALVA